VRDKKCSETIPEGCIDVVLGTAFVAGPVAGVVPGVTTPEDCCHHGAEGAEADPTASLRDCGGSGGGAPELAIGFRVRAFD
jgi:hypothetical protein